MKITVLGTRGFPDIQGGVEKHCEKLYPRLAGLGCEITVFTRSPYVKPEISSYRGVRLEVIKCPRNKWFETIIHTFKGVFAARKLRPDMLHIHTVGPSILVPLARILGLKVVMTNHGPDYNRKKWGIFPRMVIRFGEIMGSYFANEVICISEIIARGVKKKYSRGSHVIPNGIEIPEISKTSNILDKYGLVKGKFVMTIGRFVPDKGFEYLIDAFKLSGLKRWKLVIAGCADHKTLYSRKIKKKARKTDNVILPGLVTGRSLDELYSHAGLFVLPSYYEGLSISLLEAMSYGLVCLASDIPANRIIDLPEKNYFRVGSVRELSGKIREFAVKPNSPAEKIRQISFLRHEYDWDDIAKRTLSVYHKVLSAKNTAADEGGPTGL